ncbi:molybdenum cofactor guanylyltransferase, partial [Planctomycetota bacterium]
MTVSSGKTPHRGFLPAVIVLCGGKSSRMGYPKWRLPFGGERMLDRVLRITREISGTQIVVAANDQQVDDVPPHVKFAFDERPERGPLQGIHAGLDALPESIDAAFVTSCDVPMLVPGFVRRLFELLTPETQIVVPVEEKFQHPLAAVYRPSVLSVVTQLLEQDHLRPVFLFD